MVVHGSQALGLWDEQSDLDLLTQRPLVQLMKAEGKVKVRGSHELDMVDHGGPNVFIYTQ